MQKYIEKLMTSDQSQLEHQAESPSRSEEEKERQETITELYKQNDRKKVQDVSLELFGKHPEQCSLQQLSELISELVKRESPEESGPVAIPREPKPTTPSSTKLANLQQVETIIKLFRAKSFKDQDIKFQLVTHYQVRPSGDLNEVVAQLSELQAGEIIKQLQKKK